jgi:4a-hydroxytetrahydrobiopterin dehydratase
MTNPPRNNDFITSKDFRMTEDLREWPVVSDGATTFVRTDSFAISARLVRAIAEIEGIEDHRPDIDVRTDGVTVRLITATPERRGLSRRDLELARSIAAAAAALGLTPDGSDVQSVEPIIIGATDIKKVMPFWQALMGYIQRPDSPAEDPIDPRGRGPGIWFEQLEGTPTGRNRMHIAVWVSYDQAQARIAAAVAAGGTIIYDKQAPAWWTLTDPEGNEADVATALHRSELGNAQF